ncbi:DUF1801 domain-containing protein [Nocardia cyriacigeorgica]|uniref:DUF1801 domain-containing protein n=1 Tax=Nocardia cyriacigeorgica TaxID=135487 RepID=A0A6P1DGE7_9NOCA|nr:DUF1801 domain-containing protein [Nocardia cyriacigeorgica]NEW40073.1 DUF1801 domain-containing protein [Nocardia cyriacigeorgica]NEW47643.1 DUF1801 domain-containing protein [Nocardia cyriacigeorgica]NEW57738.1 DUF1801 domain-containing protein [Nocardia cyriacigeorgica]
MTAKPTTVDTYIAGFPDDVRPVLNGLRATIRATLPDAEETIRYDIPTYRLHDHNVVHFAGWKHHISLYPVPEGDAELTRALARYQTGKGTLKFPLGEPIPEELIIRIVTLLAER